MNRRNALPWLALLVVYVVWGSTYLGIRVAVVTIPPYLMTGVRYAVAGGLLFALQWCGARKKPALPRGRELYAIVVTALFLLVAGNGLLCVAETRVESGASALLIASTPIWMVLFDSLRARQAPRVPAIAGISIGSLGIVVLVGHGAGHADPFYSGIVLLSAISWAAGSVYAGSNDHGPLTAALEMLAGGVLCIAVGVLLGEPAHLRLAEVSTASLWGMLWLITGGAMLGYSAFAYAVRTLPTATVATYGYVNPVVAVILGALVLHEPITWNLLAGGALVIVSVVFILLGRERASSECDGRARMRSA